MVPKVRFPTKMRAAMAGALPCCLEFVRFGPRQWSFSIPHDGLRGRGGGPDLHGEHGCLLDRRRGYAQPHVRECRHGSSIGAAKDAVQDAPASRPRCLASFAASTYSSWRPDMVNRYPRSPSCFHAVIKPAWYAAISAARSVGGVSTGAGADGTTTFVRFRVMIGAPSPGRYPAADWWYLPETARPARIRFGSAWSLRMARAGSPRA